MGRCPECGGEAKWRSPYYVCTACGLTLSRVEYERAHFRQKSALWEAQLSDENDEMEKKRKRHREYEDWFIKGMGRSHKGK
ncbi:MAG: hypothetical protein ACTSR2_05665 [Candidatus Hodarchaeales archaeon]